MPGFRRRLLRGVNRQQTSWARIRELVFFSIEITSFGISLRRLTSNPSKQTACTVSDSATRRESVSDGDPSEIRQIWFEI